MTQAGAGWSCKGLVSVSCWGDSEVMTCGPEVAEKGADEFWPNLEPFVKNLAQVPAATSFCDNLHGYNPAPL
jgi:hypothetical protein